MRKKHEGDDVLLLTLEYAGHLLSCSGTYVSKLIQEGKLPCVYLSSSQPRVDRQDLLAFIGRLPKRSPSVWG